MLDRDVFVLGENKHDDIESSRFDSFATDTFVLVEKGDWLNYIVPSANIPTQGWKIHLSCDLGASAEMLPVVKKYLFEAEIPFKHIRSEKELEERNSRRAEGQLFGKFITIYPSTLEDVEKVSLDLVTLTKDFTGPRILTDIRVGNSVVHLRYGTFVLQESINPATGYRQEYLRSPSGEVEWVERKATFELPSWAPRSRWIEHVIEDHRSKDVILPFGSVLPLRNSSRGLIFAADYLGKRSFVKEGRRRSELDQYGRDTVDRFFREKETLEKLDGVAGVPRFYGSFDAGSSVFFAMEYLEGDSLNSLIVKEMGRPYDQIERNDYIAKLEDIFLQVSIILEQAHEAGVFHYDLSPDNILVGREGSVFIVDWESSVDNIDTPRNIFTPGFSAPEALKGREVDLFSLSRIVAFALSAHGPILDIFPENILLFPSYVEFLLGKNGLRLFEKYVHFEQERALSKSPFTSPSSTTTGGVLRQGIEKLNKWGGSTRFAVEDIRANPLAFGDGFGSYLCSLRLVGHPDEEGERVWVEKSVPPEKLSLWSGSSGYAVTSLVLEKELEESFIHAFISSLVNELKSGTVRDASVADGVGGWLIALEAIALHLGSNSIPHLSVLKESIVSYLQDLVRNSTTARSYAPGLLYGWSGTVCAVLAAKNFLAGFDLSSLLNEMIEREEEELKEDPRGNLQVTTGGKFLPYLGVGSAGVIWARDSMRDAGFAINREEIDEKILETLLPGIFALPSLIKGAAGLKLLAKRRKYLGLPGPSPESYDREITISSGVLNGGAVVIGKDPRNISSSFLNGSAGIIWADSIIPTGPVDFLPTTLLGR